MIDRQDNKVDSKLGEALVAEKRLSSSQLTEALRKSKSSNKTLFQILNEEYDLDENYLYEILSKELNIPFSPLKNMDVSSDVLNRVPVKVASHYHFMPIEFINGKLLVAVDYPLSLKLQDEIRIQIGFDVFQVLARRNDIQNLFKEYYGLAAGTVDRIISKSTFQENPEKNSTSIESIDEMAGDVSVVNLVNEIIHEAYQKRATDVHLEPYRGEFRVRYRIDGVLSDMHLPAKALHLILPVISRIKLMANLDIVEKRLPQDGRAIVKVKSQNLDLRISCIPTPHGESVVIRILPTQMIFDLKKLGLSEKNIELLEQLIHKPNGIILVTGPTGSGKTTSLYACLNRINSKEKKIITIEDPVEYEIPGITQIQVLPKVGFDFAKGLRSILRHDPDVLMVGEIRDFETAEIAMRAALTGHLVFSTLHTNDAASGVTRLLDIGLEPFLVASSIEAIIAQRLVRTICQKCKIEDTEQSLTLKKKIVNDLKLKSPTDLKLYVGKGCEGCGFTGFYGRTSIHEILVLSDAIKEMISKKASAAEVKAQAMREGMASLLQDGWKKVLAGLTTPGEVLNVVHSTTIAETSTLASGSVSFEPFIPEQRTYERLDARIEVSYEKIEVLYRVFEQKEMLPPIEQNARKAYSENISASGLLMRTHEVLGIGSILELKFKLSKQETRFIQCLGRVVRLEEGSERNIYYGGLIFLDLSTSDRNYINDFVLRLKQAEGTL